MNIEPGLKASAVHRVNALDLADRWGGEAHALASPIMIIFIEKTCMMATDHLLAQGQITVGYEFNIKHLAPTPPEWEVSVSAELTALNGRMMTYTVSVRDAAGKIGEGTHTRCIVDDAEFHRRMGQRRGEAEAAAKVQPVTA